MTMNDFTNGKDMFYICTSRRRGRTGYLYVKDRGEGAETIQPNEADVVQPNGIELRETETPHGTTPPRYITACKPSIKGGDSDELMLFRLVRYENMYAGPAEGEHPS